MMSSRAEIARSVAGELEERAVQLAQTHALLGFDGFVDSIIRVVDKRLDANRYEPVASIEAFGKKILAAAGMSSNYELVVQQRKLGGNGPIMAAALARAGLRVSYIGALGFPRLHEVFQELAQQARVISIAEPGLTDALEFTDGKLMFGKHDWLARIGWNEIVERVGLDVLRSLLEQAQLIAMVNWTMMPGLSEIWRNLPGILSEEGMASNRKVIFVDLADPEKRTREDLHQALRLLSGLQSCGDVVLGLNLREALQVAALVAPEVGSGKRESEGGFGRGEIAGKDQSPDWTALQELAAAVCRAMKIHAVVIHPRQGACGAQQSGEGIQTAAFAGPFVRQPRLSTGAGDNFNAGFCLAKLAGLELVGCLCAGTAASGYYVRQGRSPSLSELIEFCRGLPEPEE